MSDCLKQIVNSIFAKGCIWLLLSVGIITCKEESRKDSFVFRHSSLDTDTRILVRDSTIVFSAVDSVKFQLYTYNLLTGTISCDISQFDRIHPFEYQGIVQSLTDMGGDEKYQTTSDVLNGILANRPIDKVFSYNDGKHLIVRLKPSGNILYVDHSGKKLDIVDKSAKLNDVDFDSMTGSFVISYDEHMIVFDPQNQSVGELNHQLLGEKFNISIAGDSVYFTNSRDEGYSQIYSIGLRHKHDACVKLTNSNHDLRMPRIFGDYMYYVEVIDSEYLLRRVRRDTKEVQEITKRGVIYNYNVMNDSLIAYVYSNTDVAKSLGLINTNTLKSRNLISQPIDHNVTVKKLSVKDVECVSYVLSPPDSGHLKGIVIFIHPGLHADFSPRWDNILFNLSRNGYRIIAPNYPMSTGYGGQFFNSSMAQAINGVQHFIDYADARYDLPIYCLSFSSGNVLMQAVINSNEGEKIKAAAVLFGTYDANNVIQHYVPTLYIMGKNDPIANTNEMAVAIRNSVSSELADARVFDDEGHWFRKQRNADAALIQILKFFRNEQ